MKIAYTAWTWLQDEYNGWAPMSDKPKRDFEASLRDLHACGYRCLEDFNIVADIFDGCPEEFAALTRKYDIEFVNLYHYLTADFEYDRKKTEQCIAFMKAQGTTQMNLEPPRKAPGQMIGEKELDEVARHCDILGEMCRDAGISLALHPHWGTYVEREDQIDYFLAHTRRDCVGLCLDTAHTVLCGMDPEKLFAKYLAQGVLRYVHFKDIDPDPAAHPEYPPRRFRALGQGTVNFPGVLRVLRAGGYDNVICVELDFNRVNNYESAYTSRKYIYDVLGM